MKFVGFLCTALLRSRHRISVVLRSGLELGHCNTFFFFSHLVVDLLLCLKSIVLLCNPVSARLVRQMSSRLTLEVCKIQVVRLQNVCKSPLHHCAWQFLWVVCADMLCLVYYGHFMLFVHRTLCQKSCSIFRRDFANLSHVLFREQRRSGGDLSKQQLLVHSFSNCAVLSVNI